MSAFHLAPGVAGLLIGVGVFPLLAVLIYSSLGLGPFDLDPKGIAGTFDAFLTKYVGIGKFLVGLAMSTVILFVTCSLLRGEGGALPWPYASPLVCLTCSVVGGTGFVVWLVYHYEDYLHGALHTKGAYTLSLTLGFGSLTCFLLGFSWLVFRITASSGGQSVSQPLAILYSQSQSVSPAGATATAAGVSSVVNTAGASVTYWGLKSSEWITIAAIVVGPIIAVLTQLWFQNLRQKRDQKLWVYGTLMAHRATWVAPDCVRAINFLDVVFHKNARVRAKKKEWLASIRTRDAGGAEIKVDWNRANDLYAEMLDLMGKEFGYNFAHLEIKDSAYYPEGHQKMDITALELREKQLAVLNGKQKIGVIVYPAEGQQAAAPAGGAPQDGPQGGH